MSVASEAPAELARRLGGRPRAASWPPALSPVVAQVVERTRELGRFEMKAFLAAFPHVARSEYAQLRDAIPQCFRDLRAGPPGRGGWRVKASAHRAATASGETVTLEPMEVALDDQLDGAQGIVANRLAELLSHEALRRLVGAPALNSLRSLVRAVHGREPNLSKRSLAAALILRDGHELLASAELREALAEAAGVEHLARWHSGKGSALAFARALGLPEAYAGTLSARAPDDVEYLRSSVGLPPLADFQQKVKTDVAELLRSARRCVLTMPTGAGKTRTAVEFLRDYARDAGESGSFLWIAHTSELLDQAVESVRQVWMNSAGLPELRLDRRFAQHGRGDSADDECLAASTVGLQLVVATPARLINDLEDWRRTRPEALSQWLCAVKLIVIDEAHRAAAPQYQKLIEEFGGEHSRTKVLGLTATPFRNEYLTGFPELGTRELYKLFRKIARISDIEDPRVMLQERGVLSRPVEQRIETGSRMRVGTDADPGIESIESIDRRLAEDADRTGRRTLVFRHLLPVCQQLESRVIYFGPTVHDAEIVTFMLRANGIAAGFVSGGTRGAERRRAIADFKEGRLRVLCNCEVLTTGFDAPQTTHVVIARPTVSHVLFEQMVGRGLRGPQFGGTAECIVMHFVDDVDSDTPRLGYRAWRQVWGLEAPVAPVG